MNNKIRGSAFFDWECLDWKRGERRSSLEDLQNGQVAGFLIENVLSSDQVQNLIKSLSHESLNEMKVFRPEVSIYPRGFAAYIDDSTADTQSDLNKYLKDGHRFLSGLDEQLGLNLLEIISLVFNRMSKYCSFKVLQGENEGSLFPPFQFRSFHPNEKSLIVHCGNTFQKMYPEFYNQLAPQVVIRNQMSFFIVLQKPQFGGELTLYDTPWCEKQSMSPPNSITDENGLQRNLVEDESVKKMTIDPAPGDMIIFRGGKIWHSVQAFGGSTDRITVGGFFGFTKEGNHIVCWC